MKRKLKTAFAVCVVLAVLGFCCTTYVKMQKPEKMTVDETVQFLLEYIYDEDYFPLCTKYYSREDGPLLTVYADIGYPAFEFDLPMSRMGERVQICCNGESENGEYMDLGVYTWYPFFYMPAPAEDVEPVYDRIEFYSNFIVNRVTKEIIQQRERDYELIYNQKYYEIKALMVHKDFYE